jgi:glycosyltransferase involved in cell wall biosynthesis
MLRHRIYYALKPYLPWRVRMGVRRIFARRKRTACSSIWPIDETAAKIPEGWTGWPEGKKFAVVLTHDVEGPAGLAKCRQLAELETQRGFRSSFNFIPEGPYSVPPDLRQWLVGKGFEVGVHDLAHDGKLFSSRRAFEAKAERINEYLRDWGAAGFRAGFMLRNLDWYHQLNLEYDASTFDTDPFEPLPNAAGTIFPHWIPAPVGSNRPGYLELPYTLPQDSTLFLLLQETTPDIWLKKLDWVAGHGGMALVNVHPDYLHLPGTENSNRVFPAARYEALLDHIHQKYRDQFWNPTPRELCAWYKSKAGLPAGLPRTNRQRATVAAAHDTGLARKRVAVLLYSEYPADPRPRRAAEAMIGAGMEVDLFCLSETDNEPREEVVRGVRVFRLPMKRSRANKWSYFWRYGRFLLSSFWFLTRRGLSGRYALVHVHNMPDILVFSALLLKLRGTKVILDLHDPMPEVMMTIYGLTERSLPIRMLGLFEKWSTGFADGVLTVNQACQDIFSARSCPAEKIGVIMNSPDEEIFKYREPVASRRTPDRRFVIMYHGSIVERHGLDLAVEALKAVLPAHPYAELRIYGQETPFLRTVMQQVQEAGLQASVHHLGPKKLEQIVEAIRECDVGVIPNRRSLFTEINTPTRIFEYLSQGKPVIAPRARGILDYFGPDELYYFELGDAADIARNLLLLLEKPEAIRETILRGQATYLKHTWSNERHRFLGRVAGVLGVDYQVPQEPLPRQSNDLVRG